MQLRFFNGKDLCEPEYRMHKLPLKTSGFNVPAFRQLRFFIKNMRFHWNKS